MCVLSFSFPLLVYPVDMNREGDECHGIHGTDTINSGNYPATNQRDIPPERG